MAFQLKKGTDTFDFELDGKVTKGGSAFGKWKTTKDKFCRIVVTKDDGTPEDLHDTVWKFVDNQLCLFQADTEIFNFQTAATPRFVVSDKAVLQIFPVASKDFAFELRGEWDLTNNFDLNFTVNGTSSVIDGFIENNRSVFEYFFTDNNNVYRLIFSGKWDGEANEHGSDGSLLMRYHFAREDASMDEFSLPASATFDKTINQFVYEFEKADGSTTCRLRLNGVLNVGKDSRITYSIAAQIQNGAQKVFSSEIKIKAVLVTDKVEGEIELKYAFQKTDGQPSTNVLTVGGKFKFDRASLEILFEYSNNGTTRNIFFGGKLKLDNSGTGVVWAFKQENNVKSLTIGISDFKFGKNITGNSQLVLKSADGSQEKSVKFLLGVTLKV